MYVTEAQLVVEAGGRDRYIALTDWDADGTPDEDVIAQAISYVQGWIDGALRDRFATPIANPDITITQLGSAEMIYWLRSRREMVSEVEINRHKEREGELRELATGKRRPSEGLPPKSSAVKSAVVALGGSLNNDKLKGFW